MAPLKVLITDGSAKHTLAAIRSLGRRGYQIGVVDESILAQSFFSKYCRKRYRFRWNRSNPEDYVKYLQKILKNENYDVLLPISWYANYTLSKYHDLVDDYVNLAIAPTESMEIAANKDKTMEFAERVGVSIPQTISLNESNLDDVGTQIGFPLVVKGSLEAGTVRYAKNSKELKDAYEMLRNTRPIAQQYIRGAGVGFFAAYKNGTCVAHFMHARVREYPSSGGPSTAARAYHSVQLKEQGTNLLNALNWHGLAMVEFKRSELDGNFYLMEINPKFWGSLDLAIHAGVDFPYVACRIAMNEDVSPSKDHYRRDMMFRWPFPGELLSALETGKFSGFIRNFFNQNYVDDISCSDPVPSILQLVSTIRKVRKRTNGQ
ncbi:MAG: ATP-grasp domain-containing protein [Candidatus Sifarchaeia archaeon]